VGAEQAGRDHGRQEAQSRRAVDPARRRETAPENPGSHGPASIVRGLAASSVLARLALVPGGAVLALVFPFVFLAIAYQPSLAAGRIELALSDVAILLIAAVAALRARTARGVLRAGLPLWVASALLCAYTWAASVYPLAWDARYDAATHLVTAGKYAEYALLAPAAAILLRDRRDRRIFLGAATVWGLAATVAALAQFLGAPLFQHWAAGNRQPSFLGIPELGTFGGALLAVGLVALVQPPVARVERRIAWAAGIVGAVAVVLAGALAGGIGAGLAAVAAAVVAYRRGLLTPRRLLGGAAVLAVVAAGLLALRGSDIGAFTRFAGVRQQTAETTENVQTYSQRTLMAYYGLRMWRDRPLLGVGWQGVREEQNYEPYSADAHRRFPDQPEQAFPTPEHAWRIDNAFVQALAELGALGFAVFVGWLVTVVVLGFRASVRARPERLPLALLGLLWFLVAIGNWTGQGLVAGTSYDAVGWLAVGLVAAALVDKGARTRDV
jgi:O-antigen ligase